MVRRTGATALGVATLLASASAMHVGIQRVGELTPRHTESFSSKPLLSVQKATPAAATDEEDGTVLMAWNPSPIHVLAGEPYVASSEAQMHRTHHLHMAGSASEKCLSHELFQVLSEGMVVVGNIKETAESVNSPTYKGDQMSKILTLSIGLFCPCCCSSSELSWPLRPSQWCCSSSPFSSRLACSTACSTNRTSRPTSTCVS